MHLLNIKIKAFRLTILDYFSFPYCLNLTSGSTYNILHWGVEYIVHSGYQVSKKYVQSDDN